MIRGDVIGHFRRHHLLVELLESYFLLTDQWYLGPIEAMDHLKRFDLLTHKLFQVALMPGAPLKAIKALVDRVSGPRPE